MYEAFFGLTERPFELTPNLRYLCLTARHREALSTLKYGITTARGITVLLGEAGTGKTTLIHAALKNEAKDDALCVCLTNPTFSRSEFIHFLADQFELSTDAAYSKMVMLRELSAVLRDRRSRGALTTLIIDEAQSLPYELLEEVRLLANLETEEEKLLPVVLVGQPELAQRLNEPSLRQLKQRVALRCTLTALDLAETAAYIDARLRVAGGVGAKTFTRQAVELIYKHSAGIPRVIGVICDNALLAGFASGERPVTSRRIAEICADFDLNAVPPEVGQETMAAAPPTAATVVEQPSSNGQTTAEPNTAGREIFETVRRDKRFSFL